MILEPGILKNVTSPELTAILRGHTIVDTGRHGKYLFAILENGLSLIFHFGMTGGLTVSEDTLHWPPYIRFALIFFFDGSSLAYHDPRKLGRISSTLGWRKWIRTKGLGPDALHIRLKEFREQLSHRKGMIKPILMNQVVIAGIGNLYADEILFKAKIHPRRLVGSLTSEDIQRMYTSLRNIFRTTLHCNADETCYSRTFLIHQRFPGGICPNCGKQLERISINGRTAYFCSEDQPDDV